jgi:hypothetical protein
MLKIAWAKNDPRMCFSYYAADRTTDSDFFDVMPEERANPSMSSWTNKNYLEEERRRLPSHKFRRLHLNLPGLPEGSAFSAEKIVEAIEQGVKARPPDERLAYFAFTDMSGGSNDDACLAITHKEQGRAVLDICINQGGHPPFDPMKAVASFATVLKEYRLSRVIGDRYAGQTFRAAFQKEGVGYEVSAPSRHELYEAMELAFNTGSAVLLDNEVMESQFYGMVWRGSRIDHLPNEHDDFSNAASGALWLAAKKPSVSLSIPEGIGNRPLAADAAKKFGNVLAQPYGGAIDDEDDAEGERHQVFRFHFFTDE